MKQPPVQDIHLKNSMTSNELIKELYNSGGFIAQKVAQGVDILEHMITEKNCVKFLSFPACIVAIGTRGIIRELME